MSKIKYLITLIALGWCGGTIYIIPYIRYSFYTQLTEAMGCTNAQLGMLTSMYALIAIILFIPGGIIADKFDAKKLIIFSLSGCTILTVLFGLTLSYTASVAIWAGLAICTGTTYWPAFNKFLSTLGDEASSGRTFGYYYAINGISAAIVNAITLAVATSVSLKAGIMVIAASTAIAVVLIGIFIDDEAKAAAATVVTGEDEKFKFSDLGTVLKSPSTWIFGSICFCAYAIYSNTSYFTPYLVDVLGVSPESSTLFSIIRTYVFMLLAPIGGIMADTVLHSTAKWLGITLGIIAALYVGLIMLPDTISPSFAALYTLIPAAVAMSMYGIRYSVIRELHVNPAILGTVIGVSSMISWGADFVLPTLFGSWLDKFGNAGYTYIFVTLGICGVVSVVLAIITVARDKKFKAEQAK